MAKVNFFKKIASKLVCIAHFLQPASKNFNNSHSSAVSDHSLAKASISRSDSCLALLVYPDGQPILPNLFPCSDTNPTATAIANNDGASESMSKYLQYKEDCAKVDYEVVMYQFRFNYGKTRQKERWTPRENVRTQEKFRYFVVPMYNIF